MTIQNRLDSTLALKKKLLSIYLTAGFPRLNDTVPLLESLQESGVDLVEIGESVARAGLRKLAIINSHGGNVDVIAIVARELRAAVIDQDVATAPMNHSNVVVFDEATMALKRKLEEIVVPPVIHNEDGPQRIVQVRLGNDATPTAIATLVGDGRITVNATSPSKIDGNANRKSTMWLRSA